MDEEEDIVWLIIAVEEEEGAGCETFKASAKALSARIEIRIY